MATVTYVGRQETRRGVYSITVGSNTNAQTFTITIGSKTYSYTASGDTTTTIAAALYALVAASTEGEYAEITWAANVANVFTATGPTDGAPVTITAGGTGTLTVATTTAPLSPSDLADVKNYSTGALPSAADTLVFEDSAADAKYNATALAGIALASVIRRKTHTGRIGLLTKSPNGYVEYRTSDVSLDSAAVLVEQAAGDGAGQVRVNSINTACTFTVQGDGSTAAVGDEVVNVRGLVATSVLRANGGSVSVASLAGQVATIATLAAQDATVWLGSGVTLTNPTYKNCTFRQDCSSTTLTQYGGAGDMRMAAAVGNSGLKVYSGALNWRSTGATGNSPLVGTGGAISFDQAPASVTVGGTVALYVGSGWSDPAGKCGSYTINPVNCTLADVALNVGTNKTLAVS